MELGINYVAIVVATVATFILSFLWYSILFRDAWAKENGFDTSVKPAGSQIARGMVFQIIGCFLMAYVFAHNNAAWSFVPGMDVMPASAIILNAAIFTWLGFFVPQDLSTVAWEKKSWKLFFINTGYHLASLVVAATILTLMK
jgi:hypothetical protein